MGSDRAAGEPIIEVQDVVVRYGDTLVLDGVSFSIDRGEVFGIVGGSGSGKSTLMRQLIGLMKPDSGRVVIDGVDLTEADEEAMQGFRRRIGVAFQHGAMFTSLTVGENVALVLEEHTNLPRPLIDTLVRIKLGMVALEGKEDLLVSELSGGMLKRAGLARAMALDPQILFFDEPSAGLDPITAAELDALILRLNRSLGTTIVVVTHDLASIFTIADRVVMLDPTTKRVLAEGSPESMRASDDAQVRSFFNREPGVRA